EHPPRDALRDHQELQARGRAALAGRAGAPPRLSEPRRSEEMPSEETRRVLKLFGVAVTNLEDAIDRKAPRDELMKWDAEAAEVTRTKTKIGGEKTPDLEAIRALGPDLVVANVEENVREHIEQLRAWAIPVWVTYPRTVADGLRLVRELGEVTGTRVRAAA